MAKRRKFEHVWMKMQVFCIHTRRTRHGARPGRFSKEPWICYKTRAAAEKDAREMNAKFSRGGPRAVESSLGYMDYIVRPGISEMMVRRERT